MAEVDSSLIKHGFWINYSYGTVVGATLTTHGQTANAIVALIAIFISIGLTSVWNLLVFTFHQLRATSQPKDGLFRQQQVLYRSLPSPGSTVVDLFKLHWRWRYRAYSAMLRCTGPSLLALLFSLGSLVAGVFSSYIVTSTNVEVLVKGTSCTNFNYSAYLLGSQVDTGEAGKYNDNLQVSAAAYAEQCYTSGPISTLCNFYVTPRVNFSTIFQEPLFSPSITFDNSTGAIVLDSGYLDSNDVFGINASPHNRIQFRRKASCTPLNTENHVEVLNQAPGRTTLPGEQYWAYNYGKGASVFERNTIAQSTYFSNLSSTYTMQYVYAYQDPMLALQNQFVPLEELNRTNSDITVATIFTNAVVSLNPINGPIYSAHHFIPGTKKSYSGYMSDGPGGSLGCTEQYDFCIQSASGTSECTGLGGARYEGFEKSLPSANPVQLATLNLFGTATALTGFGAVLASNENTLNSTSQISNGYVYGLPDDQWVLDVQRMEGSVWAMLQVGLVWHFTGYLGADPAWLDVPTTASETHLCYTQKVVKAGGFANINVFGLAFTLTVSVLFVILDYGILRGVFLLRRLRKRDSPMLGFWIADGIYQLQRTAYEKAGAGTWSETGREIPLCGAEDLLGDFQVHKKPSG